MDRPRCVQCRNPIKEHQAAVGPKEGDRTFHEDCWTASHPEAAPAAADAPVVAAETVVEQRVPDAARDAGVPERTSEQRDYEQRIASGGLAALLSPYVSGMPAQRDTTESVPA